MFETNDKANGVGLAAPQVGVGKRIFVYKYENEDGAPPAASVVNPVLTLSKVSGALPDPDEEEEGCLSFPGDQYPLKRADWVRVQGFDGDGEPVEFEATGLVCPDHPARVRPPGRQAVRQPPDRQICRGRP